ncbi:hypothetical protein NPIL_254951 [Nephila pilipes]|uniref:Uncharacterized protein n=1 Tax=Nephila pilipes TaxID=299642 RepID=A0A8X6THE6_NEPPI|nr:hypothetical protein NPIL_254951 [Nephila pilipes]
MTKQTIFVRNRLFEIGSACRSHDDWVVAVTTTQRSCQQKMVSVARNNAPDSDEGSVTRGKKGGLLGESPGDIQGPITVTVSVHARYTELFSFNNRLKVWSKSIIWTDTIINYGDAD